MGDLREDVGSEKRLGRLGKIRMKWVRYVPERMDEDWLTTMA